MTLIEPGQTTQLVAGDINDIAMKLTLQWQADRFGHSIDFFHSGGFIPIFATTDESSDDAWPAQPPLQQASLETVDGRPAILGVGMAGSSHWSISIEALQDEDGKPILRFDCACRIGEPPGRLGSEYRCLGDLVCQQDAFAGTYVQAGDNRIMIVPNDSQCEIATMSGGHRWIASSEPATVETPTVRWSYKICIA